MEQHLLYLFYIAIILIIGLLITVIAEFFSVPNILFLVIAGYALNQLGFAFFSQETVLVLAGLALIMIALESGMELDISKVMKESFPILKFVLIQFVLCIYVLTLLVYQLFPLPGDSFTSFALCLVLSIIVFGVDPSIVLEFFSSAKHRVKDMLDVEGLISTPIVIVFSSFVIGYIVLSDSTASLSNGLLFSIWTFIQNILVALIIGGLLAYILHRVLLHFVVSEEIAALLVVSIAIAVYAGSEALGSDGTIAVAIYAMLLRGLTLKSMLKTSTSFFAKALYLMVFILLGIQFVLPEPLLWFKGLGIFFVYLVLRFCSTIISIKNINIKERLFITLNISKGIEVAVFLFLISITFSSHEGIFQILSLGYMFFIYSLIISSFVNHYSGAFLNYDSSKKPRLLY